MTHEASFDAQPDGPAPDGNDARDFELLQPDLADDEPFVASSSALRAASHPTEPKHAALISDRPPVAQAPQMPPKRSGFAFGVDLSASPAGAGAAKPGFVAADRPLWSIPPTVEPEEDPHLTDALAKGQGASSETVESEATQPRRSVDPALSRAINTAAGVPLEADEEDEDLSDLFADDVSDDRETALRELVTRVVIEELQGPLGERITRNVRKLVRREVQRALAMRDFD